MAENKTTQDAPAEPKKVRQFGYISADVARKTATGWTEEIAQEVSDAWDYLNGVDEVTGKPRLTGKLFTDFDTVKDLGSWLRQAKAYAESRGIFLRRSGVRGAADTRLYFMMETIADREIRLRMEAEAKEKLAAAKAAGQEVKPGRKPGAAKGAKKA